EMCVAEFSVAGERAKPSPKAKNGRLSAIRFLFAFLHGRGAERPSKTSQEASVTAEQSNQELTAFVSNLLKEMQTRFQSMSDTIVGRIDDMTNRVDELERNIQELANK
ncbi:Heat shock factor-binding protein 1, partial [Perkinsus olseni]